MLVCETPIKQGPNRGLPAIATGAGYQRHVLAGEPACAECRAGVAAEVRQWRADNAERYKAYDRERRAREAEIRADRERKRRAADPDRFREDDRRRRAEDPEYSRKQYWANPDRNREKSRLRRARKAAVATVAFSADQLRDRLSMFSGCWMCGADADTVDHVIPLALGGWHCLSNLRPACNSCNASKGIKSWRDVA